MSLILLTGLFFYPASTTLVLVPAAHLLVTENTPRMRLMAIGAAGALGCSFVALFVIHKFIVLPRLTSVLYLGEYEFSVAANLIAEIPRRLQAYLDRRCISMSGLALSWIPTLVGSIALIALGAVTVRAIRGRLSLTH